MSDWTLNGRPVLHGTITAPLHGRWVADLAVDAPEGLAGDVVIEVGGIRWRGAIHRGGVDEDTWNGRVVGGTTGLDQLVTARSWHGLQPARGLVRELLSEVGEALSDASGPELDTNLPRWSRIDAPAHHALADLARAVGARWRVLFDGTVWVGAETWPELFIPDGARVELLSTDSRGDASLYALPAAWVQPGQVFDGRRVGSVAYELAGGRDRVKVWWTP